MGKLLNSRQLRERLGISRATFYRWLRLKWLPPPVNSNGWPRWDLDEVEHKIRERDPDKPTA